MTALKTNTSTLVWAALPLFAAAAHGANGVNEAWNRPIEPYRVAGNIYYVGTNYLASFLFVTPQGLILLNSDFAIVIALLNFLIPLGVLPIFSAMQNISPRLLEAAEDLGASRIRTVRTIVLPLTTRGIRAAFALCFIATMAEWESRLPRSTRIPAAAGKSMIQPGSVRSATRISP